MTKTTHVRVKETFSGDLDGVSVVLNKGQVIPADDPIAKRFKRYFEPLVRPEVEKMTAAPGEKR